MKKPGRKGQAKENYLLKYFFRVVLSGLFLAWLAYKIPLEDISQQLLTIEPNLLFLLFLLTLLSFSIGAVRWYFLINLPYRKIFFYNLIGHFFSILPSGQVTGDFIKGYLLKKDELEEGRVYSSILVDKILGVQALSILGVISSHFSNFGSGATLFFIVLNVVLLFARWVIVLDFFRTPKNKISFMESKMKAMLVHSEALKVYLRNKKLLVFVFFIALLYQVMGICSFLLLAKLVNLHQGYSDLAAIFCASSLLSFVPASFLGIGAKDLSIVGCLAYLGEPTEKSLALLLIIMGIQLSVALVGCFANFFRP